ncbi:MAG: hypothetical protein ACI9UV_000007 [Algoriphagus sp.]
MIFITFTTYSALKKKSGINLIPLKMKHQFTQFSLNRSLVIILVAFLALGACKSKKKVVAAPAPPAPVAQVSPPPAPVEAKRSAEEMAVENLENAFNGVANASSVNAANQSIQQALGMFSNQETPILIVIHEENGIKDYDEPTTIKNYLDYLKDTKKNLNYISDIRLDANGKVSELELRRK